MGSRRFDRCQRNAPALMRIAVMQPCFLACAGYFRMSRGVDALVVHDTARFPCEGWAHGNRPRRQDSRPDWHALPLARTPAGNSISDVEFHARAESPWQERWRTFPACSSPAGDAIQLAERAARFGVRVQFLPAYRGQWTGILQRLHREPAFAVRREIGDNLR